jgi:L-rhamnose isomerase
MNAYQAASDRDAETGGGTVYRDTLEPAHFSRWCDWPWLRHLALDFFDASLNRIAADVIGIRATRQALLYSLLDPSTLLARMEAEGRFAATLALMETIKTLPFGTIWEEWCVRANVPVDIQWVAEAERYEREVLLKRV